MRLKPFLAILVLILFWADALSQCSDSCTALASYYLWSGTDLTLIATLFSTTISNILSYNPQITDPDNIQMGNRINVPFSCGCVRSSFMGGQLTYQVRSGDYYERIATLYYSNLTTVDMLTRFNDVVPTSIPVPSTLNVVVNCTCGNKRVSTNYGLFITYPLRSGQTLSTLAGEFSLDQKLLQDYNPGVGLTSGSGLVFVPGKDQNGTYPPLKLSSSGISGGAIAGICIGVVAVIIVSAACFYFFVYKKKRVEEESFLQNNQHIESAHESVSIAASASPRLKGITVDRSVEFTFEELSSATNNFDISYKIGQGGFGAVYYAELRGEKAAIKKMDMQASKEFLAELKVLTRVHHVNLVRLIGYCVEGSLFLVYEYIDNGNLSQHLRGRVSEQSEPLPWTTRVQIALDSARGLEYIHEHTVEVYIHRDIKSANILIDKNFRAKVADFGLTKLTKVDSASTQTRLVGTYGYMAPEYAQYGDASPKIDVYAFGVVLYELISAKEAIVKGTEVSTESKGLVALFEDALKQTNETNGLKNLTDPRLGEDYPLDSVSKVAHLARACTHENPQLRPTMRSIVVALMTLSSSTEDWDIGAFYENQGLVQLMSGR